MSIEIRSVSKTFGKTRALDRVSLTLEEGHIYGLLGNNGAGKTTLLSILTDRQRPDSGEILVDGMPVRNNDAALGKLFMVSEHNLFPEEMKVKRALDVMAYFYPAFDRTYAEALAEKFELPLKKKISALSTGYTSIFRLVLGLSANTPYLLLDEPVLGLDAQHRDLFYRLLVEKFALGTTTILLSTHLIDEAETLVDHTIILRKGTVLKNAPTEELTATAFSLSGPEKLVDQYTEGKEILSSHSLGGLKTVSLQGTLEEPLPPGLEKSRLRLQDYFISLQSAQDHQERKELPHAHES
ncbi:MAG: ABC transporter ATP-binding protein [Evtepia sp.]|uniref:ABC transporter ATP-binding protein n=1 Tax=Evtepia sp. TaxID=2773933 RepID=UPI002A7640A4|nr:ABC transporter ATP-binding protein [Evtepia sp.]MDY3014138.1 ABC transporter ATP-binding protein [Evtepia sp.]